MQSFRTEIENPLVQKDIIELEKKIRLFKEGKIDEEKFRSLRLARGVYGQRQLGVQMIRIKIPYGKMTTDQLLRISDVSDEYSKGRLHTTTRQDIQIHHVSLDRTPQLWEDLEKSNVTLREACGNAVRNVVGSPLAGVDKQEAFDVSPYAQAVFEYFLRQPFGQELGRKFKIAFSGSIEDTGLTHINDLGFIAQLKATTKGIEKGFKVLLAGGLGAQAFEPKTIFEFLPTNQVIPLIEASIRVFDRYGERKSRSKARIKYLIKDLGVKRFLELIKEETIALKHQVFEIDSTLPSPTLFTEQHPSEVDNELDFQTWIKSNVTEQKQTGFYTVAIKLLNGDFYTDQAREIVSLVRKVAADDIRITPSQNLILKYVRKENLAFVYNELKRLKLADNGYDTTYDITACPGTDTCNLGISNSTSAASNIEGFLRSEYPELIEETNLKIKISGCMNACGQHTIADIGLHGSSIKAKDGRILPALQIMLGGQTNVLAERVIKVPSKRILNVIATLLNDFKSVKDDYKSFNDYYWSLGKRYFYDLLKPFGVTTIIEENEFIDWGESGTFQRAVGVGECAGVVIDLVSTLFLEVEEKLEAAKESLDNHQFADSAYFSYSAMINASKALLIAEGQESNSHKNIADNFKKHFIDGQLLEIGEDFDKLVFQIKDNAATHEFAKSYWLDAKDFYQTTQQYHSKK